MSLHLAAGFKASGEESTPAISLAHGRAARPRQTTVLSYIEAIAVGLRESSTVLTKGGTDYAGRSVPQRAHTIGRKRRADRSALRSGGN
jgi:hypothetical protein